MDQQTVNQWQERAKRDNVFFNMTPGDLREILGELAKYQNSDSPFENDCPVCGSDDVLSDSEVEPTNEFD